MRRLADAAPPSEQAVEDTSEYELRLATAETPGFNGEVLGLLIDRLARDEEV
jgi:hypothetical protein